MSSARGRGRPRGSSGAELLTIARNEFVRHGFDRATMDAVAANSGVSKQTLYRTYRSKDLLFAAVVRDWVDRGYDALRPHALALLNSTDIVGDLYRLATVLQAGILSAEVMQMRTLVATQAASFPDVARDYVARSWNRNINTLAEVLAELTERGELRIEHPRVAAEQFVWLAIGAPLNRLSLCGDRIHDDDLSLVAREAVATFLGRYRTESPRGLPQP
ncbi:TetR/AcrR family transcriptional regulator [Nocardia sp. NEAU-G5]|uniref:TetR/AcrR family transcriptional regulator n=1 Tax=Nocardia albiluteola TaxID=2842303 RepID=A0ABS6AUM6_9NOCA|nr:TetR/AcrR family transcriptional regulator [Nocardia albiluteola]MBU3061727.1 TetR/AcrR family transcriptional regulator [Nocardia albiluteola]